MPHRTGPLCRRTCALDLAQHVGAHQYGHALSVQRSDDPPPRRFPSDPTRTWARQVISMIGSPGGTVPETGAASPFGQLPEVPVRITAHTDDVQHLCCLRHGCLTTHPTEPANVLQGLNRCAVPVQGWSLHYALHERVL